MNKEQMAFRAARHIVDAWESTPTKAEKMVNMVSTTNIDPSALDTFRSIIVQDLQSSAGGEELYQACKTFLISRDRCAACGHEEVHHEYVGCRSLKTAVALDQRAAKADECGCLCFSTNGVENERSVRGCSRRSS